MSYGRDSRDGERPVRTRKRSFSRCEFNRSMQHLDSHYREKDVENEAWTILARAMTLERALCEASIPGLRHPARHSHSDHPAKFHRSLV